MKKLKEDELIIKDILAMIPNDEYIIKIQSLYLFGLSCKCTALNQTILFHDNWKDRNKKKKFIKAIITNIRTCNNSYVKYGNIMFNLIRDFFIKLDKLSEDDRLLEFTKYTVAMNEFIAALNLVDELYKVEVL